MTMQMPEGEVFSKLTTDTESLTLSESFVRSDIANIIQKIYSPRPLVHCTQSLDNAEEARDIAGDHVRISRSKEMEEKRFGSYFEPVTACGLGGHFARTLVDSSTTSGSVSMPMVRYKPKRLRQVCECCRRKIPYREYEVRAKRACLDCRICKRNYCYDMRDSSTGLGPVIEEEYPSVHCSKVKMSNHDIDRIRDVDRIRAGSSLRKLEEARAASTILERKRTYVNLTAKHSYMNLNEKLSNNQGKLDPGSVLNQQDDPCLESRGDMVKKQKSSTRQVKKQQDKNSSFLKRAVSNLFGKSKTNKLGNRLELRKNENFKCTPKKLSKTSMKEAKENKHLSNNELLADRGQSRSSAINEHCRRGGNSRSYAEIDKLEEIGLKPNRRSRQTVTNEYDTNLRNVVVHSCPDLSNTESKSKIDKKMSVEDRKSRVLVDKVEEIEFSTINDQDEPIPQKPHDKYHVAYNGLKIERDADWAYEFWGEVFGTCHSVVSFFTAFFLHLLTFVLQSVIQPVLIGSARVSSDHFFKPCLSTFFESLIQPVCILIERLLLSLRDVCSPVAQCLGEYCKEVSHVCRACRVVEIHKNYHFNNEEP